MTKGVGVISMTLITILVALFGLFLNFKQRQDSWVRSFNELHQAFWQDGDFEKVRAWIANDQEYSKLDPILQKRFSGRGKLSGEEYKELERLDKFFNLLLRAHN